MFKVGDKPLYGVHDLAFGEVWFGEYPLQLIEKSVNLHHLAMLAFLHHTKCGEAIHRYFLARHEKFLIRLLSGGVALEVDHWITRAVIAHTGGILFGFRVACAFHLRESFRLHKIVAYLGERQHLVFAEFRKKHLATIAENACKHTDLS